MPLSPTDPYLDYNVLLRRRFPMRVQKIVVQGGFSCPNRDGRLGTGGCLYCNNRSFTPDYGAMLSSVSEQIEAGISFFRAKYPGQRYLAYFQSYTNTYAPFDTLTRLYDEALRYPGVVGLVVATRPDCITPRLLTYFEQLTRRGLYVMVEYGVESTNDDTLRRIRRGHTFAQAEEAIRLTASHRLAVGAHLILGLPGETRDDALLHARRLSALPLTMLKLHQLQIIRGSLLADLYAARPEDYPLFSPAEYVDLCVDFLERLSPSIAVERFISQSPPEWLIAPDWGLKNYQFLALLRRRFLQRHTFQGLLHTP